jgi:hypothetical protein
MAQITAKAEDDYLLASYSNCPVHGWNFKLENGQGNANNL